MKQIIIDFVSSLISVILGIVITFAVQGRIDKLQDRKEVESALRLVRTELAANRDDIRIMQDFLKEERQAAAYFMENRKSLGKCPEDSISFYSGILFAEASITLSHDALELLKMSSLFQKIGNNDLSMKIIRAYDTGSSIAATLNNHFDERDALFQSLMKERFSNRKISDGVIRTADLLQSDYGIYSMRQLAAGAGTVLIMDLPEMDEAIDALDTFLDRKKHK